MKDILIPLVAVIILSTILDIVIQEGQTKKYIKGIVSLLIILVLVSGIAKAFKQDFKMDWGNINYEGGTLDNNFLSNVYKERYQLVELKLQKYFKEAEGLDGVIITILFSVDSGIVNINAVSVNLKNLVITNEQENININIKIKNKISKDLNIKQELIIING